MNDDQQAKGLTILGRCGGGLRLVSHQVKSWEWGSYPRREPRQDHGRVPMPVAIGLGRLDQLLDLGLGQMLPLAVVGVGSATRSNCSLFAVWPH